ncbi:hypothetical protein [Roseovarius sp. EL26]|uniref:hypothetical protein n=1 Tax=Roseovarius sp. EL26 TaxID=2126672 RepID=UPI000EA17C68|nr:hypothetical protein [Roseovarius sp. EL26]
MEKLQEAEYFLAGVVERNGLEFQFHLNAFLSACRSTTFVLQKSMKTVPNFAQWYQEEQKNMKTDLAMGFFLELRNISQHEGPVGYVGEGRLGSDRWTYRFAGNREAVPEVLLGADIAWSCAQHLLKLANLLSIFLEKFEFSSCPANAISSEGMAVLGYSLEDVEAALGLPIGYLNVAPEILIEEKLRYIRKEFEPLDVTTLARMSKGIFHSNGTQLEFLETIGRGLVDDVAQSLEKRLDAKHPRDAFIEAIAKRIDGQDK